MVNKPKEKYAYKDLIIALLKKKKRNEIKYLIQNYYNSLNVRWKNYS
jgi:hypothetical protein